MDTLAQVFDFLLRIWRFEITSTDGGPVAVSNLVIAVVLFFSGLFVAKKTAQIFRRRVLDRLPHLQRGVRHAIQLGTFYSLVVIFALFALYFGNIPLTIFTLLGGALALGVGFGSQNIINNFVSGLILLLERPIRVGDLVDVDGTFGTVQNIGIRSTRIRSFDNIHVVVPNSFFVEKNVTNWTLSDSKVRVHMAVGVAYGSPTREVERIVGQAVREHEKTLEKPEPIVLFRDFGDSSLLFEVYFWLEINTLMDRWRTESDIRFRIDELFRQAGIVIAFPQQDVHVDTAGQPLAVRVVSDAPQ